MSLPSISRRTTVAALGALVAAGLAACTATPQRPPPPRAQPTEPPRPPALFGRPAAGAILSRFDGQSNKGIDIAGNLGDPVLAAADGRVVYVGGELRGYGNMIIIKHDETFLTAYAHNSAMLVKENDVVRRGQKIAEMGDSAADRVKLHFEIRRQGVAVDPLPYLDGSAQH